MVSIQSGSNLPETTHVLMGDYDFKQYIFDVNNFNAEDKAKYDAFFNAVGNYATVNIINIPGYDMDINRVAPISIAGQIVEIDYATLSAVEKTIVDEGLATLAAAISSVNI